MQMFIGLELYFPALSCLFNLFAHTDVIGLELYSPALSCLFNLFAHADVIGFELYFPALRCLFNLFAHADVIGLELYFPALRCLFNLFPSYRCLLALTYIFLLGHVYSICFLKQMLLPFALCFLH